MFEEKFPDGAGRDFICGQSPLLLACASRRASTVWQARKVCYFLLLNEIFRSFSLSTVLRLDLFPVAKYSQDSPFTSRLFSFALWRQCDGILNHTDLYEYKHGKMLMHLKFCFEGIPEEPTPAAMLRYYRQRKGLTTRQLAESIGIVPATVLMYEREEFPIPYLTVVAFADILEIDRNLLCDDFARFMDYSYSDRLREVRKAHGLNQADFAKKAEISYGVYAKWKIDVRQPSRKMYEQLVATYPEKRYKVYSVSAIKQIRCIFNRHIGILAFSFVK